MNKNVKRWSLKAASQWLKPWILCIGLVVILRYTGILSAVSSVTQQGLMKTGILDAKPAADDVERKFNYNFKLVDLNKNEIDMESLKGKPLFINVWATWCGPCRVEMPSIQSLYNSVDKEKINFIMLALDQKDPYQKVAAYVQDKGFTFPVYLPHSTLPDILQVRSIPATFVVDKEGKVIFREIGTANYDTDKFRDFLKSLY